MIEHLKFNQIVRLCELAYDKLEDGGYIIMETPNPMSLAIYTHAFYMDPSHNKPIHPLTMEYFMRKVGFKEVEILFTESSKYPADIPKLVGDHGRGQPDFIWQSGLCNNRKKIAGRDSAYE